MTNLRQVILGFLAALLSTGILLGSLSLALIEGGTKPVRVAVQPAPLTHTPSPESIFITATYLPGVPSSTFTPTVPPTNTPTPTIQPPTACPPPADWFAITVLSDDTLDSIARRYNSTAKEIAVKNCLVTTTLLPGAILYVPMVDATATSLPTMTPAHPTALPTPSPAPCGPPAGWVVYSVKVGESLYTLAAATGTSLAQLQNANCLSGTVALRAGQLVRLPFIPIPRLAAPTQSFYYYYNYYPTFRPPMTYAVPTWRAYPTVIPSTYQAPPTSILPPPIVPTQRPPATYALPTALPLPTTGSSGPSWPTSTIPPPPRQGGLTTQYPTAIYQYAPTYQSPALPTYYVPTYAPPVRWPTYIPVQPIQPIIPVFPVYPTVQPLPPPR